jgi:hypothetical protein
LTANVCAERGRTQDAKASVAKRIRCRALAFVMNGLSGIDGEDTLEWNIEFRASRCSTWNITTLVVYGSLGSLEV